MTIPELVKEKIKKVTDEIEKNAHLEILRLREEFEKEKIKIKEEKTKKAEELLKLEKARRLAESRLKALKEILNSRTNIYSKLLEILKEEIEKKRRENNYKKIFEKLFEEAITDFGEKEGRIIVSPSDRKYAEELVKAKNLNFEIIENPEIFAGLIVERRDGKIRVLNTLESRLKKAETLLMEKLFKEIFQT